MRLRLLPLLALLAGPLAAQPAVGDLFFEDGPRAFPPLVLSDEALPTLTDAEAARAEQVAVSLRSGWAYAAVRMTDGRPDENGADTIEFSRDRERRIRTARHVARDAEQRSTSRTDHVFDTNGRTAGLRVSVGATMAESCDPPHPRTTVNQTAMIDAEGRLLSVRARPMVDDVPNDCFSFPSAPASLLAYPTVGALLAALDVPALDALEWVEPERAPPPAPPPND